MDLPEEPLHLPGKQQKRITKDVQRHVNRGREKHEKYIQCLRKEGYSEKDIESMLD
ncbi:MAG TPA: hypothetical protein VKM55_01630 [Candidatus Lokiarchaeia archaeon]|nr:hypothetical protein [Candidatus Lokiarchaeia archaeon]